MIEFRDDTGRVWSIRVTLETIRRVKADTGFVLTEIVEPGSKALEQIATDPICLFEVLVAVVSPQMKERDISVEQFADALTEESLDKATDALIQGIVGFFQNDRAKILSQAFDRTKTVLGRIQKEGIEEATRTMQGETFDQEIEKAIRATFGKSALNSQE